MSRRVEIVIDELVVHGADRATAVAIRRAVAARLEELGHAWADPAATPPRPVRGTSSRAAGGDAAAGRGAAVTRGAGGARRRIGAAAADAVAAALTGETGGERRGTGTVPSSTTGSRPGGPR